MNALFRSRLLELTRFEYGIIRRKAGQLIGRAGFSTADRRGLEQELAARLIQAFQGFDPQKADRKAFATMVVERSIAKILRFQNAEKRNHRRTQSLNVRVKSATDGWVELAETIGTDEYDARRGCATPDREKQIELQQDVQALLDSLPADLREIAEQLKHKSVAQIARDLDLPRSTLRYRLRELREWFEAENLQFYL